MRAKPAAQHRSQEKLQSILNAMEALLKTKPFEEITITDISAKAGVSPATIYQRFRNRDAAGAVLLELYFKRVEEWARRQNEGLVQMSSATLYKALMAIGCDAWDQVEAIGYIMRPAYLYSRQHPGLAGEDWRRMEEIAGNGFNALLERHADEITIRDRFRAAGTTGFVVNLIVSGLLLHSGSRSLPLLQNRETFATELADLVYRYLTHPKGKMS
jgi:AcrR family transcriptional regulator